MIKEISKYSPVKCLKISSPDEVWYIDGDMYTWSWKFKINTDPECINTFSKKHR